MKSSHADSQNNSQIRANRRLKGGGTSLLCCRQATIYGSCTEVTAMILSDVFERFAQDSPLTVMARGLLENSLIPRALDQLFEDVADQQYTKKLLFSSV